MTNDDPAYRLAASRMFLCADDVTAIEMLARPFGAGALIIDLGAGSGTTALAVCCANSESILITVDRDREALQWAYKNVQPYFADRPSWALRLGDAAESEICIDESVDLLLHDAGHEYDDVHGDLLAWWPKLKPGAHVWIHDYGQAPWDGAESYPGVKQACEALVLAGHYEEIGTPGMGWVGRKPLGP